VNKIRSKITVTYVFLTVIVVAALGILSSVRIESYFQDRLISSLSSLANVVSFIIHEDPLAGTERIDARITTIAQLEDVRITIITLTGAVVAESDVPYDRIAGIENHLLRPEVQIAVAEGTGVAKRKSTTVDREFMYVARKISAEPDTGLLGTEYIIRVAAPLDEMKQSVREIRSIMLIAGLMVLIGVAAVSVALSLRISKPLFHLAESVREIQKGNIDKRIDVQSTDEIGMVAATINELLDKVNADISRMQRLERYRREFLGNVSHELRTPIFSLQGFIETLLDGAVDDPNVNRDFLRKAHAQAARLNNLLGDLITISQIETGEMKMNFHYFPVREFLETILADMQPTADQHNVVLRGHFPAGEKEVRAYGDKQQLSHAMRNLIENAIKYNKPYGEVIVGFERLNDSVRIQIKDTGIGIPDEHISRVFERFYRVDRDRSRDVGGTGLGLAIVKHIVEAHGASIRLASTPEKGSTFYFDLKAERQ
jgi:two-component system, OmpR family, phosphate regulon sensor histidine kinase PhoR